MYIEVRCLIKFYILLESELLAPQEIKNPSPRSSSTSERCWDAGDTCKDETEFLETPCEAGAIIPAAVFSPVIKLSTTITLGLVNMCTYKNLTSKKEYLYLYLLVVHAVHGDRESLKNMLAAGA